jgi:hypothetical protein
MCNEKKPTRRVCACDNARDWKHMVTKFVTRRAKTRATACNTRR